MADLRVNKIPSDLLFDLKVMALDKQVTLRKLVIDQLTLVSTRHMVTKISLNSKRRAGAK
jgi:hypothetical protein